MQYPLQQKFNDDLLIHKEDQELAAKLYPTVLHVLDHPELRKCFTRYDEPANAAKKKSRKLGSITIMLASVALFCASGEIIFYNWPTALIFLALAGVICGVSSVVLGSVGVLYGRSKSEWLHQRLMTERLRQFHFQTFLSLLPEIIASVHDDHATSQFTSVRGQKFQAFCATMEGHLEAVLTAILHDEDPEPWFEAAGSSSPILEDHPALEPLFRAYRHLRIEHQKSYADFKIRDDGRILSNAARRQSSVLEGVGFSCIVLLLAIHIAVGTAILIGWLAGTPLANVLIPLLNAAIIWIAIVALAARTLEQGLQSESEIERYQQYGSACKAILERFDAAPSQAEKARIMAEMERLAFDEMRDFLITNQRARFVM